MTLEFLAYLALGAACGGFINGLAGFGTALFALGWWLQVMPPVEAVSISLAMSVISGIQGVVLVWPSIDWARLARFILPALIGVPLGVQILSLIDPGPLKIAVAAFLVLYGGFFTFRRNLPNLTRRTPGTDMTVGFLGGVLGGAAGLSGALPTMWCTLRAWTKSQQRAVLQPFNVTILGLSAVILAVRGAYDGKTLVSIAIALPVTMLAAQLGITVFKRLRDDQFRKLLIGMLFVSGLVLAAREIF
jgi:uncharacterized membrane protein YfcA